LSVRGSPAVLDAMWTDTSLVGLGGHDTWNVIVNDSVPPGGSDGIVILIATEAGHAAPPDAAQAKDGVPVLPFTVKATGTSVAVAEPTFVTLAT
jgi:hypothetical protein